MLKFYGWITVHSRPLRCHKVPHVPRRHGDGDKCLKTGKPLPVEASGRTNDPTSGATVGFALPLVLGFTSLELPLETKMKQSNGKPRIRGANPSTHKIK